MKAFKRESNEQAKEECTIAHEIFNVCYDDVSKIWKVVFSAEDMLGSCQTVYMDSVD